MALLPVEEELVGEAALAFVVFLSARDERKARRKTKILEKATGRPALAY